MSSDQPGRPPVLVPNLRMLVDVAPPGDRLLFDRRRGGVKGPVDSAGRVI